MKKFNDKSTAMRNILISLIAILLPVVMLPVTGKSQTKAIVQNVDFQASGDSLIVTYDILKSKSSERFKAYLQVKNVTGKLFETKTVSGDLENVSGGKGKRIIWNVAKDNVLVEGDIYVNVVIALMSPEDAAAAAATGAAATGAAVAASTPPQTQKEPVKKEEKVYSKGGALLLSAIMPGLGITKLRDGGAYWLIGIADYGLLAGGIVLNVMSNSSYNKYKEATTASDRDNYYDKAVSQNKTGNTLLYVAGGLWVVNMIITAVVPAKPKFGFSVAPTYDPAFNQPMLTVRYRIGK